MFCFDLKSQCIQLCRLGELGEGVFWPWLVSSCKRIGGLFREYTVKICCQMFQQYLIVCFTIILHIVFCYKWLFIMAINAEHFLKDVTWEAFDALKKPDLMALAAY